MDNENAIFRSLAMIEERIREKLSVEELAKGVHFSKYHYQRMFREALGESVMRYVTRRKLILAAGELAETDHGILDVALGYGFDSHEGFTRSFKACMGMTPSEYRRYHRFTALVRMRKEKDTMLYSKNADEIIRELNGLIVKAGETAAYTGKHKDDVPEVMFYARFWEYAADRAEETAGRLTKVLGRVTDLAGQWNGISARFLIVKAVEDAAFAFSLTAFQTGLTVARALPEHREAFRELCGKYEQLARDARMTAGKTAGLLKELSELIFRDMRKEAGDAAKEAVKAGRAASEKAAEHNACVAEELSGIAEKLSGMSLEEITVYKLENFLFQTETIEFAARTDALRGASDQEMLDGIAYFKERLNSTADFFRNLPEGVRGAASGEEGQAGGGRGPGKLYGDLAVQEEILLFYLKGEIQKLKNAHLTEEQEADFRDICGKLKKAVESAYGATGAAEAEEIRVLLGEVYEGLTAQAEALGAYGGAIRYIAEEIKKPMR